MRFFGLFLRSWASPALTGAFLIFSAFPSFADELSSALRTKMRYLGQNQAVISKNLANSNTPKYKAMELKEPDYKDSSNLHGVSLVTTSPMHIGGANKAPGFKKVQQKDTYETAPNGNNVSIEEQMVKMSKNSLEHQSTANILRKVSSLKNLAIGDKN